MADAGINRRKSAYWSVDIPEMTRGQAEELLALLVKSNSSLQGIPVDPAKFLTVHMDRDSVNVIRHALAGDPIENSIADGLIEIIDEWLEQADDG